MNEMKNHLENIDEKRLKIIFDIKEEYVHGKITLEEGQQRLKDEIGQIKPYEIALAEQELKEFTEDQCEKESIQKMIELFDEALDMSNIDLEPTHPISYYFRENNEIKKLMFAVEDLVQYPVIKNQWLELYERIGEFKIHLSRKQNQLYSVLEKKGFDRPTTTMWTLDNFVRDEISEAYSLLSEDKEDEFISMQERIVADVRDLLQKEESVLYPTALAMITPSEFEEMKEGDIEIGFAFEEIDTPQNKKANLEKADMQTSDFAKELTQLLTKHGLTIGSDTKLDVATGKLTLEQINLIYKHMPVDISYVDENELVCFYTDTAHRIFPRSKNVIGRNVKNCHPRASVHVVEEVIESFRSGKQDTAEFWINKPNIFIYIYYVAVRDENGNFKGVLEMMQDCTHIRSLTGSRTLLTWDEDEPSESGLNDDEIVDTSSENEIKNEDLNTELFEKILPTTKLSHLLTKYPYLKNELPKVNKKFSMLNSALAKVIIPTATVKMMSERSNMDITELIENIKQIIIKSEEGI